MTDMFSKLDPPAPFVMPPWPDPTGMTAGEVDAMLTERERAIADHERRVDEWESFMTSPRGFALCVLRAARNQLVFCRPRR